MPKKKSQGGPDKDERSSKTKPRTAKLGKALRSTKSRAAALASNPAVAEVVAAILVSTAAALRDPAKARALAGSAGDELKSATAEVKQGGSALRQIVLDVARRSIDAIGGSAGGGDAAPGESGSGGEAAGGDKAAGDDKRASGGDRGAAPKSRKTKKK